MAHSRQAVKLSIKQPTTLTTVADVRRRPPNRNLNRNPPGPAPGPPGGSPWNLAVHVSISISPSINSPSVGKSALTICAGRSWDSRRACRTHGDWGVARERGGESLSLRSKDLSERGEWDMMIPPCSSGGNRHDQVSRGRSVLDRRQPRPA